MSNPSYPGVYVQETSSGVHPIAGVSTSIAAFIGWTPKGSLNTPVAISSFSDYKHQFGDVNQRSDVSYAVQQFFDNGGTTAFVVRVSANSAKALLGNRTRKTGLYALLKTGLFNILSIPGTTRLSDPDASQVISSAVSLCEERRAMMLVDTPLAANAGSVQNWVKPLPASANCAVYFPWIESADILTSQTRAFPPTGAVAGIYARTDNNRGIWKAPAGPDATVTNAIGLAAQLTDANSNVLNPIGVNCLRKFPASGIVVWGSRTLSADAQYKYVNVRRLALYIEESLYRGLQWAVFEPNQESTWAAIRLNVNAFLTNLFRDGAFAGAKPEQAFYVKCDRTTTTQADIDAGIVNVEVGFAPLKPAEFVVFRIHLKMATGS